MSKTDKVGVKFRIPRFLWEKFFRMYPGWGERTRMLRDFVYDCVERGYNGKSKIRDRVGTERVIPGTPDGETEEGEGSDKEEFGEIHSQGD